MASRGHLSLNMWILAWCLTLVLGGCATSHPDSAFQAALDSYYAFWRGRSDNLPSEYLCESVWIVRPWACPKKLEREEYPGFLVRDTEEHLPNLRTLSDPTQRPLGERLVLSADADGHLPHEELSLKDFESVIFTSASGEAYARGIWALMSQHEAIREGDRAVFLVSNQCGCIGPHVFRLRGSDWSLALDCGGTFVFPGY